MLEDWSKYADPSPSGPKSPDKWSAYADNPADTSTVDIKDGKLVRTHPSKMNDDEIATRILGLKPEEWAKAKQSGAYKVKSRGGKVNVLAEAFTDPEGYWGSYVVGKNKDTPGAGVNKAVQSLFAGGKRALLAGEQFAGSLVDRVYGDDGSSILQEALLRANAANQNINQGRQPGKSGVDLANMAGQAAVSSAMTKGRPSGGLGARLSGGTATNFAETALTTPGSTGERLTAGGTAAAVGNVAEGGTGIAKVGAQKLFGISAKDRAKAAARKAALDRLNAANGTNLELTAGQLSGNQNLIGKETLSESLPFGLSRARQTGNDEMLKLVNSRVSRSAEELGAAKFSNLDDLVAAFEAGDKNAARILRDFVENSGTDPQKIFAASKEVNLFPLKQRNNALWELFKSEGDAAGPISMHGEVDRLNPLIADMERVIGPDAAGVRTAKAVAEDLSAAQREIFPSNAPGSVNEFLSGSRGAESIPKNNVPGSIAEFLEANSRTRRGAVMPDTGIAPRQQGVFPQPPGNVRTSNSTVLNAGNIQESISRLKTAAAGIRDTNPRLAGELDQIVTGMDTRLEQAASQNPSLRATLDAAKMDTKYVLRPVEGAETAITYPGSSGGPGVAIPQAVGLEERGLAAARNQIETNAQNQGFSYGRRNRGYIDTDKAATSLENPAVGQFYSGEQSQELADMIDILRATRENGQYMTNPKNGSMLRGLEMWKLLLGGGLAAGASVAPTATAGAAAVGMLTGPAARGLFNTKVGRELLLSDPEKYLGLSPELASMLGAGTGQLWGGSNPIQQDEYYQ